MSAPAAVAERRRNEGPRYRAPRRGSIVDVSTAIVLVESLTGNTWKAGEKIAANLQQSGWGVSSVCSVRKPDLHALETADLVLLGSWTDGIFVAAQRPAPDPPRRDAARGVS